MHLEVVKMVDFMFYGFYHNKYIKDWKAIHKDNNV